MTIILSPGVTDHGAYLGYDNLLTKGTVSASSAAVGFEAVNASDWLPWTWWQPATAGTQYLNLTLAAAAQADYLAIASHDLGLKGASVQLQYSTDNATWTGAHAAVLPAGADVVFVLFPIVSARYWRVMISATASLGIVSFGRRLKIPNGLPDGFTPPALNRQDEITNNEAESGAVLGRTLIRRLVDVDIRLRVLEPDWVRREWVPLAAHAATKPLFFAPQASIYPGEAVICWCDSFDAPRYSGYMFMEAGIKGKGRTR